MREYTLGVYLETFRKREDSQKDKPKNTLLQHAEELDIKAGVYLHLRNDEYNHFFVLAVERLETHKKFRTLRFTNPQEYNRVCLTLLLKFIEKLGHSFPNFGINDKLNQFNEFLRTTPDDALDAPEFSPEYTDILKDVTADMVPVQGSTVEREPACKLSVVDETGKIRELGIERSPEFPPKVQKQNITDHDSLTLNAYQTIKSSSPLDKTPEGYVKKAEAYVFILKRLTSAALWCQFLQNGENISFYQLKVLHALQKANQSEEEAWDFCQRHQVFANKELINIRNCFNEFFPKARMPAKTHNMINRVAPYRSATLSTVYWSRSRFDWNRDMAPLPLNRHLLERYSTNNPSPLSGCTDAYCKVYESGGTLSEKLDNTAAKWLKDHLTEFEPAPLVIASIGSGGLRRDLDRLIAFKGVNPKLKVHLIVIDPIYATYLSQKDGERLSLADATSAKLTADAVQALSAWMAYHLPDSELTLATDTKHLLASETQCHMAFADDMYTPDGHYRVWDQNGDAFKDFMTLCKEVKGIGLATCKKDRKGPDDKGGDRGPSLVCVEGQAVSIDTLPGSKPVSLEY